MRALLRVIMTCAVGVTCTAFASAQLPGDCSSADQDRGASFATSAEEALRRGDADLAVSLMHQMESGLSPGCRAALDRQQPARVRCTANERKLVLDQYAVVIGATFDGNIPRVFEVLDRLEASLSPPCWLAVNQSTDPGIRQACSAAELDTMASFAGPLLRATRSAVELGDQSEMVQVLQNLQRRLSRGCNQALVEAVQRNQAPSSSSPARLPSVHDHGGGTYSVDGVGMCTPSECTLF